MSALDSKKTNDGKNVTVDDGISVGDEESGNDDVESIASSVKVEEDKDSDTHPEDNKNTDKGTKITSPSTSPPMSPVASPKAKPKEKPEKRKKTKLLKDVKVKEEEDAFELPESFEVDREDREIESEHWSKFN